jgi:hypothetical protein
MKKLTLDRVFEHDKLEKTFCIFLQSIFLQSILLKQKRTTLFSRKAAYAF